jgi:hypothetical protein
MFGHVVSAYYLNFDDANVNNDKYWWVYQGRQHCKISVVNWDWTKKKKKKYV